MRNRILLFLYIPHSYVHTNALTQTNVRVCKLTQMKYVYTNKMRAVTDTQTVTPLPDFKISRKACKTQHWYFFLFFYQLCLCVCVFACRLKGLEIIKIRASGEGEGGGRGRLTDMHLLAIFS